MSILGQFTIAELTDFIAAMNAEQTSIQNSADANRDLIATKDAGWFKDWDALHARYVQARVSAEKQIIVASALPGVRPENNPGVPIGSAGKAKDGILRALKKDPSGPYTDQDLQGLYNRLDKMGIKVDLSKMPQPRKDDPDIDVLKTIPVNPPLPPSPKKNPWPYVIGGGLLLGVGAAYVRAVMPRNPFRRRTT